MMADIFIYTGLGIMLLGAIFGLGVAVKGYKETDWSGVRKISIWGGFQRGGISPVMRKLTYIWVGIMIMGFIFVGIGLSVGLN